MNEKPSAYIGFKEVISENYEELENGHELLVTIPFVARRYLTFLSLQLAEFSLLSFIVKYHIPRNESWQSNTSWIFNNS